MHSPRACAARLGFSLQATVREALMFSARLRLPREVTQHQVKAYVEEVRLH